MSIILLLMLLLEGILMLGISVMGVIVIYFMLNSKFMLNAPPVSTSGKVKKAMLEDISKILEKHKRQTVIDLGSGWGALLLPLAQKFPNHRFVGIEYDYIPYLVSRFRSRKLKNVRFYRENFFNANISNADIILLFLLTRTMPKVKIKFQSEAKKGVWIYTNRFLLPGMKAEKEVNLGSKYHTYYTYKI